MSEKIDKRDEWPPDDEVIYVSDEIYRSVYRALDHMEKAREELRKAAENTHSHATEGAKDVTA